MKTVEIFLYDGVDGMDVMGPLEVFSVATEMLRRSGREIEGYQIAYSASQTGAIRLGAGLEVLATRTLDSDDRSDYFLVPGAMDVTPVTDDQRLVSLIQARAHQSDRVISVCTGAFILAHAGLLDGRSCSTHWSYAEQLQGQFPETEVNADAIYVEDDGVYTSAGITAGIDLALALVEQDYGVEVALETARTLVLYMRRPGFQSQFSTPLKLKQKAGKDFAHLYDWLLTHLEQSLQVEQLAAFVAMSPRNFSRVFSAATGLTPARYVELMRIEKAKELLATTEQSIAAIANSCGFQREERMRRAFTRSLGITPSLYRSHFSE